ncbi:MAG: hypothetical protein JWQ97_829 [Phenylobacterium sp.]|nr:hypothetical protein [Phenylobacterium sp.]
MHETSKAATAREFSAAEASAPPHASRLVQLAPGPEAPSTPDKTGVQRGMVILLVGGGVFWAGVAALALYLMR